MPSDSATQKALFLTAKGGDWKVDERPIPKPSAGQVLIKIYSTALNPIDWKIQKTGRFVVDYPAVVGLDAAGEIVEVGEGVSTFNKGDRVVYQGWCVNNDLSTFQQYGLCPAEIVSKIPDSFSFDDAATIPLGLGTAFVGLYNPPDKNGVGLTPFWAVGGKEKYKNEPIVILGGSSSVGQFAIQAAKLSGFNPIIATSSLKHETFLKDLGATHVIDRSSPNVTDSIKKLLPGGFTSVAYDSVASQETQKTALELVKPDGKIVLVGDKKEDLDFGDRFVVRTFGSFHAHRKIGNEVFQVLCKLLEDGSIKPNRVELLKGGLRGITEGLKKLFENKVSGVKLVAHPWE